MSEKDFAALSHPLIYGWQ